MKIAIIIQARMGSTRLPGKVLKKINGMPMLLFQYERLLKVKKADLICIATTVNSNDNVIFDMCIKNNIPVFRGSEDNVLKRYYDASNYYNIDLVVRINSDCPLVDPNEVDKIINKWIINEDVDYVSNILEETYPLGMHIEVFSRKTLKKVFFEAKESDEKEHVTPYIYRNPNKFKLLSIVNKVNLSDHRWTVDYSEDIEFIQKIVSKLTPKNKNFKMTDIVELVDNDPSLRTINNMYTKKQNLM